jgi:molybdopterin converting factor small subunit
MVRVLLLGPARQAAGEASCEVDPGTVGAICGVLEERYGAEFAAVLGAARLWVDGRPARASDDVPAGAELSVLPPVSGG